MTTATATSRPAIGTESGTNVRASIRSDRIGERRVFGIVRIPDRRLPEGDPVARHVEVPELWPELVGLCVGMVRRQLPDPKMPSVNHGYPLGGVPERHREVDVPLRDLA